jgi:hypothetical protein
MFWNADDVRGFQLNKKQFLNILDMPPCLQIQHTLLFNSALLTSADGMTAGTETI